MSDKLVQAIADMREEEALSLARERLESGEDPLGVLRRAREAMEIVGSRYAQGSYFLPELIMAGEMLSQIAALSQARMGAARSPGGEAAGTVVLGTVKGDIHDIGKGIVRFMLEAAGFRVVDLGVDVPSARFVEAVRANGPRVVALSGLLTLAYDPMKETVAALREAGLRDRVRVMIGGGAINESIRAYTGADAYGEDAVAAVALARDWTRKE